MNSLKKRFDFSKSIRNQISFFLLKTIKLYNMMKWYTINKNCIDLDRAEKYNTGIRKTGGGVAGNRKLQDK